MKLVAIFSNGKKVRRDQKRESNAATTQQLNATEVTAFLREKHQPHADFKHPNGKELVIWGADGDDAEEASEDESEQYEIDGLDSDVESEDDGGALRPAYAARPVLQCPSHASAERSATWTRDRRILWATVLSLVRGRDCASEHAEVPFRECAGHVLLRRRPRCTHGREGHRRYSVLEGELRGY